MKALPKLDDIVSGRTKLPTLPGIAVKLIDAVADEETGVNDIGDIIVTDPPLTAKVLALVNSSFYGFRNQITSVHKAIGLLGLDVVKNLALSFSLIEMFKGHQSNDFNYIDFWKRSLISAVACKLMATKVQPNLKEDAFVLGLIHDIGILALWQCYPEHYQIVLANKSEEACSFQEAEDECLSFNHMEMGHYLIQAWGLPDIFALPIRHHHHPLGMRSDDANMHTLTKILHLASLCADIYADDDRVLNLSQFEWYLKEYRFSPVVNIDDFHQQLSDQVNTVFPIYDMTPDSLESYNAIIDRARSELVNLAMNNRISVENIQNLKDAEATLELNQAKKKILIVDDEERNIKLVKAMLQNENFEMVGVPDGFQALKAVDEVNPDIILLDVMMPGIDGFKVCRRLKQNEKTRMIPILMVTALNKKEHRQKALEAGADDFLSKPIDRTELELRVSSLVRIKSYHDQLRSDYMDMLRKNAQLKELEETKEGLMHMIVHDMKNPLFAISSNLELLLLDRDTFKELKQKQLQRCFRYCEDLINMTQSLLDVHKMENGRMDLNKKPIALLALTDQVVGQFKARIQAKHISLSIESPRRMSKATVDEELLKRVVANLVDNAVRHTPSKGEIVISLIPPNGNGYFMFKIRDTGQGIQPEDQEKIFYKFEQSGSGENDHPTGANGLGLAFCKLAVEAHGGKIWVESDGQGKGSTFQFYLPVQNE